MYENNLMIVNHFVINHNKSIKMYYIYTLVIFVIGITVIIIGQLNNDTIIKTLANIGGSFISSLSGLSIKELISKKERIGFCESMKLAIEINRGNEAEQEGMRKILHEMIIKNL